MEGWVVETVLLLSLSLGSPDDTWARGAEDRAPYASKASRSDRTVITRVANLLAMQPRAVETQPRATVGHRPRLCLRSTTLD